MTVHSFSVPSGGDLAYRRITDYVRSQFALGKLKPGDRLPPIRSLAGELRLNPGTVARAYQLLERDGVIITGRGKGSFIAETATRQSMTPAQQQKLDGTLERAIVESLALGFSVADIEQSFLTHIAGWREQTEAPSKGRARPAAGVLRFEGSHDLAVELLARHARTLQPDVRIDLRFSGSLSGLLALERGEADIAGSHLLDEETGDYNVSHVRKLMPNESVLLVTLMQRIQGLMVSHGNPKHIIDFADLARPDVVYVNRQKGSGTRNLLDGRLRSHGVSQDTVKGYTRELNTHIAVAAAIARGTADVGLGAQSAASAAGLDFIPVAKERYDLVLLQESALKPPLNLIPDIVAGEEYRKMLTSLPGYDTSATGRTILIRPGA